MHNYANIDAVFNVIIVNFFNNAVFFIEFIIDITDYLLDDILNRYDSAESAVFINQNSKMMLVFLHFAEERVDILGLRNKICRSEKPFDIDIVETY